MLSDIPLGSNMTTANFADNTAHLTLHINPEKATSVHQTHLNNIQNWLKLWRIGVNETQPAHNYYIHN